MTVQRFCPAALKKEPIYGVGVVDMAVTRLECVENQKFTQDSLRRDLKCQIRKLVNPKIWVKTGFLGTQPAGEMNIYRPPEQ